jgi:soluble lytic murein transglycosylase-like protein
VTRRLVAGALLAALAAGCVASEAAPRADAGGTGSPVVAGTTPSPSATPSTSASPTPSPSTAAPPTPDPPAPDEPIPSGGAAVARALAATFDANREAVAAWIEDGDPRTWPPPREVVLLTLYEQRILRELAAHPKLAARVLDRLRGRAARESAANVAAGRALFEHFTPVEEVPDFRIRRPEPADALLGYFVEAEERFGVAREVLAAIMLVETRMGRIRSRSSAGAQGPMQFLPSTWAAYGLGGDVHDPHDAVLGAANYLRASGAPSDYRAALHAYNPVDAYVTAVLRHAGTMRRFPDSYYVFYDWQVFVRTVDGDVRLSGPGL